MADVQAELAATLLVLLDHVQENDELGDVASDAIRRVLMRYPKAARGLDAVVLPWIRVDSRRAHERRSLCDLEYVVGRVTAPSSGIDGWDWAIYPPGWPGQTAAEVEGTALRLLEALAAADSALAAMGWNVVDPVQPGHVVEEVPPEDLRAGPWAEISGMAGSLGSLHRPSLGRTYPGLHAAEILVTTSGRLSTRLASRALVCYHDSYADAAFHCDALLEGDGWTLEGGDDLPPGIGESPRRKRAPRRSAL